MAANSLIDEAAGMTGATLGGRVQTVAGLIEPAALAATLMQEHVLCDLTPPAVSGGNEPEPEITLETVWAINYGKVKHRAKYRLDQLEVAIDEVGRMVSAGGGPLGGATLGGLEPRPTRPSQGSAAHTAQHAQSR